MTIISGTHTLYVHTISVEYNRHTVTWWYTNGYEHSLYATEWDGCR